MSDNMKLWRQVETTDLRYTKEAKVGGQQITSLNGTAMIMKATEVLGPAGLGFGWTVLEERFDQGGEVFSGEGDKRISLGHELNHTVKIKFWFELDGKRGEFEQYGCTAYMYKSKYGLTTDGEAPKKSLTDSIKKSLSMLGFSADVFLGYFEDREYVQYQQEQQAIVHAEDQDAEVERQKQERLDWLKSSLEVMAKCVTINELNKVHAKFVRDATRRSETPFVTRLARAFDERKTELEAKTEPQKEMPV